MAMVAGPFATQVFKCSLPFAKFIWQFNTQKGSVACSFIEKPVQRWIISAHTDMTIWKTWQTSMSFRCMQLVSNLRRYLVGDNGKTSIDTPNYMWLYKSNHPASVLTILYYSLLGHWLWLAWALFDLCKLKRHLGINSWSWAMCRKAVMVMYGMHTAVDSVLNIWPFFATFQILTVTTVTKSIGSLISRSSASFLPIAPASLYCN